MKVFIGFIADLREMTLDLYNDLIAEEYKLYRFSMIDLYGEPWNIFIWSLNKVDDVRCSLADWYMGDYQYIAGCEEVTDEYNQYPEA